MKRRRHAAPSMPEPSAFVGFRFPPEVIVLAVRWYLRFGLSYSDLEELLAERGIEVDHVTLFRWGQRFTPVLVDAARPLRRAVGGRWFVDETYAKVTGRWRYAYRAVDQHGQVIDVYVSGRRDIAAARRFFTAAIAAHGEPDEVVTDLAPAFEHVIDELLPGAFHNTAQYAKNRVECDHGRLKARLRPMRRLKTDPTARVIINGHALMQNRVRRRSGTPSPRPLRTRCRSRPSPPHRRGVRRAQAGHLITPAPGSAPHRDRDRTTQQCRSDSSGRRSPSQAVALAGCRAAALATHRDTSPWPPRRRPRAG